MEGRGDSARRDAVDADPERNQFLRHAPRHVGDEGLRRTIDAGPVRRPVAGSDGGCVDDETTILLQVRYRGGGRCQDGTRVEVHHRIIMLVRHLGIGHARDHATGIVDEPVEATEGVRRLLDHAGHLSRFGSIAADQVDPPSGCLDLLRQGLRGVYACIVVKADKRPLRGEFPGQRRTDSGRGAGDQHGFFGKVGNDELRGHVLPPRGHDFSRPDALGPRRRTTVIGDAGGIHKPFLLRKWPASAT